MTQLVERVSVLLGRDVHFENMEKSVADLCDHIDELRQRNLQLEMKNKNIMVRAIRAKWELDEVVTNG